MIKKLIFKHKGLFALTIFCMIVYAISSTQFAFNFQHLLDSALKNDWISLWIWIGILSSLMLPIAIAIFGLNNLYRLISLKIVEDLRANLGKTMAKVNYQKYHANNYFENGFIYDSYTTIITYVVSFMNIIKEGLFLLVLVISLFILNPYLGLFSLIVIILIYFASFIARKKIYLLQKIISNTRNNLNESLNSSFSAFKRLYLLNNTKALSYINKEHLTNYLKNNQKKKNLSEFQYAFLFGFIGALSVISYIAMGLLIFTNQLPFVQIMSGILLINYVFNHVPSFSYSFVDLNSTKAVIGKLKNLIALETKEEADLTIYKQIKASNLSMFFGQKELFNNLNFKLASHDKVLIYGKSGKGKSTLVKLLLGIINPTSGLLKWGTQKANINILGKNIAYIQNKPQILPGTIDQNITLFEPEIDQNKLARAKKIACIDFALDDAKKLSTGQRQRIEIASALYFDAPTLIFDESLANIDHHRSQEILKNLLALKTKRIIVISHHLKNEQIASFSQIINLNQKNI